MRAPGNVSRAPAVPSVTAARGWPRRAENSLKIAESTRAGRRLKLRQAQATNALALQEWRQVDALGR